VVIVIGKPIAALVVVRLLRYPFQVAIAVSIALAQIGEFSFVLARFGKDLDLLPAAGLNVLVAASILSIVLNPILYRFTKPMATWVAGNKLATRILEGNLAVATETEENFDVDPAYKAIVVGYGPVGKLVVRLLNDSGIIPTVIDLNPVSVTTLNEQKVRAIYGDASHIDTLTAAGLKTTNNLILTSSEVSNATELIRSAKKLNPKLNVLARTDYLKNRKPLLEAGAQVVFSEEGEIARAIANFLLKRLNIPEEEEKWRWIRESLSDEENVKT
jgi:CPA2 family monovalent cation:H+ antiporter-2